MTNKPTSEEIEEANIFGKLGAMISFGRKLEKMVLSMPKKINEAKADSYISKIDNGFEAQYEWDDGTKYRIEFKEIK